MSVRDAINSNPWVGACTVGVLLLAALGIGYKLHQPADYHDAKTTFYTDDDGQSYYRDSILNFAPFDHDGKTAVMAMVFTTGDQNFVAYLMRFTELRKKQLEAAYAQYKAQSQSIATVYRLLDPRVGGDDTMEVKLPGAGNPWLPRRRLPELRVKVPGGGPAFPVMP